MNPLVRSLPTFHSFTSRGLLSTQSLLGLFISIFFYTQGLSRSLIYVSPITTYPPGFPLLPFADTALIVSFMYLRILPLRRAFCCRQPRAASGIALLPLPGWASLWLLFALSTLSSLRQAKIH